MCTRDNWLTVNLFYSFSPFPSCHLSFSPFCIYIYSPWSSSFSPSLLSLSPSISLFSLLSFHPRRYLQLLLARPNFLPLLSFFFPRPLLLLSYKVCNSHSQQSNKEQIERLSRSAIFKHGIMSWLPWQRLLDRNRKSRFSWMASHLVYRRWFYVL